MQLLPQKLEKIDRILGGEKGVKSCHVSGCQGFFGPDLQSLYFLKQILALHLCDTPFCNTSRGNCAIPHKDKRERVLQCYRYKYRAIWRYRCWASKSRRANSYLVKLAKSCLKLSDHVLIRVGKFLTNMPVQVSHLSQEFFGRGGGQGGVTLLHFFGGFGWAFGPLSLSKGSRPNVHFMVVRQTKRAQRLVYQKIPTPLNIKLALPPLPRNPPPP